MMINDNLETEEEFEQKKNIMSGDNNNHSDDESDCVFFKNHNILLFDFFSFKLVTYRHCPLSLCTLTTDHKMSQQYFQRCSNNSDEVLFASQLIIGFFGKEVGKYQNQNQSVYGNWIYY